MAARVIGDDDADYSFLIKQCSSQINCCSVRVWFAAIHATAYGCYPAAGVKGITVERSSNRVGVAASWRPPMLATGIIGGMARNARRAAGARRAQRAGTRREPDRVGRCGSLYGDLLRLVTGGAQPRHVGRGSRGQHRARSGAGVHARVDLRW
jgi:hypothetical protein